MRWRWISQLIPMSKRWQRTTLESCRNDRTAEVEEHLTGCDSCCALLADPPEDSLVALLRRSARIEAPSATGSAVDVPGRDATRLQDSHNEAKSADSGAPTSLEWSDSELGSSAPLPEILTEHARYRVLERIGSGGMGDVYRAEHSLMQRPVAVKLINRQVSVRPGAVERFRREVRAAARLSHPNIVAAYDAEQAGDHHFLVMEHVEGANLHEIVRRDGPLPIGTACDYIRQAALGLQHAFGSGMVHRDIKPQNLMVTPAGQVKILDFGLAKFASETDADTSSAGDSTISLAAQLTHASTTLGTPDYIAPEQSRDSRQADIRADIYSLGCTLYFLLAGRPPFPEGSVADKLRAHAEGERVPITTLRDDVPSELAAVMWRMMGRDPDQRYQTPADVAEALRPFVIDAGLPVLPIDPPTPPGRTDAEDHEPWQRLQSPANGLLATAILNLISFVVITAFFSTPNLASFALPGWILLLSSSFLLVPLGLLMIQGGLRMRRLESHRWARWTAIAALLPLSPLAWPFGVLFGVWSLVLLRRRQVRNAFPDIRAPSASQSRWLHLFAFLTVLGYLATGAAAAAVIYIKTDTGTIAIETDDPQVQVIVEQNGERVTILDKVSNQQAILDAGTYTLRLGRDAAGFELSLPEGEPFYLKRGAREVVTLRRADDPNAGAVRVEEVRIQQPMAWRRKISVPHGRRHSVAVKTSEIPKEGFPDEHEYNKVTIPGGEHELTARIQRDEENRWILGLNFENAAKRIVLPERSIKWLEREPRRGYTAATLNGESFSLGEPIQLLRLRADHSALEHDDGTWSEFPPDGPAQGVLIWLRPAGELAPTRSASEELVQIRKMDLQEPLAWRWRIQVAQGLQYAVAAKTHHIPKDGLPDRDDHNRFYITGGEHDLAARIQKNEEGNWTLGLYVKDQAHRMPLSKQSTEWLEREPRLGFGTQGVHGAPDGSVQLLRVRENEKVSESDDSYRLSPPEEPSQGLMIWLRPAGEHVEGPDQAVPAAVPPGEVGDATRRPDYAKLAAGTWRPIDVEGALSRRSIGRYENGVLTLDDAGLEFRDLTAADLIVRAKVRRISGANVSINLRQQEDGQNYNGLIKHSRTAMIGRHLEGRWTNLDSTPLEQSSDGFVELAFAAVGDRLLLYVDGRQVLEARDDRLANGFVSFNSYLGIGEFKNLEYQSLDPDPAGFELLRRLSGHQTAVMGLAVSRDGERSLSVDIRGKAILLALDTGQRLWQHQADDYLEAATLSPDGSLAAVGGGASTVTLLSAATGERTGELDRGAGDIRALRFSPDGKLVAAGGWHSGDIHLWDAGDHSLVRTLSGGEATSVEDLAFTPDGTLLIAGGEADALRVFDVATGELVKSLDTEANRVEDLAFSPDGALLISGGRTNGTARVYHLASGQLVREIPVGADIGGVGFLDEGQIALTADFDGVLSAWDATSGRLVARAATDEDATGRLAVTSGDTILTAGGFRFNERDQFRYTGDYALRLWRLPESVTVAQSEPLPEHAEDVVHRFEELIDQLNRGQKPEVFKPKWYDALDRLSEATKSAADPEAEGRKLMMRVSDRLARKLRQSPEAKRWLEKLLQDYNVSSGREGHMRSRS